MLYFSVTEISTSWLACEVFCLLMERWKLIWEENPDQWSPPGGLVKHRPPQLHVNRSIGQTKKCASVFWSSLLNTYVFALKFWFVWCCGWHSEEAWLFVHLIMLDIPSCFLPRGLTRVGVRQMLPGQVDFLNDDLWGAFKELSDFNILKETFFSLEGREGMRWTN